MNKEMLLAEIITQTIANVFKNNNISYFEALQQSISNLENIDKKVIRNLFESLNKI